MKGMIGLMLFWIKDIFYSLNERFDAILRRWDIQLYEDDEFEFLPHSCSKDIGSISSANTLI